MELPAPDKARPGEQWALAAISLAILVAYGAIWTRGVQGDDLCMCELASAHGYWDAVQHWLNNWNGRLFLALTQIGTYHLPWFSDPLRAPWYLIHATVVLAHVTFCGLLFNLLVRAGIASGSALTAVLIFAIHPITSEPVLWLAESYGYVFGNLLTLLTVWVYLEYERRGTIVWLGLTLPMAIFASLGIEQYLFVLGAIAVAYLSRSLWQKPAHSPWLPLLIVTCCALVFAAVHFGLFSGTAERIARTMGQMQPPAEPGIVWKLAWWLSLLPNASPYGGILQVGLQILMEHPWITALIALVAVGASWRIAAASSWLVATNRSLPNRHLWLIITGLAVFSAALLPFAFTESYGIAIRNVYVALPGLVIAGAAVLDLLSGHLVLRTVLRLILAPFVAAFVIMSLILNIGAQALFASSWQLHLDVIETIRMDADAIRQSRAVEITGIPPVPYKAISQLGTAWAFPCLVRWTVGENDVTGWNNLMKFEDRPSGLQSSHRIHLQRAD